MVLLRHEFMLREEQTNNFEYFSSLRRRKNNKVSIAYVFIFDDETKFVEKKIERATLFFTKSSEHTLPFDSNLPEERSHQLVSLARTGTTAPSRPAIKIKIAHSTSRVSAFTAVRTKKLQNTYRLRHSKSDCKRNIEN